MGKMAVLPLQAVWVWIVLGVIVAAAAWWKTVRPGAGSGGSFASAVGVVIILVLALYFHKAAFGGAVLPF